MIFAAICALWPGSLSCSKKARAWRIEKLVISGSRVPST